MAARPATLWAAMSPVIIGSALAEWSGSFRLLVLVATLVVSIAMQVGVNIANDVADASRGADNASRIGPPRAVASGLLTPRQAWIGVWASFALAGLAAIYLVAIAGWVVVVIGIAAIAGALGYTSGPAYGYHALGELSVFVYFGIVATVGSRYVYDMTWPPEAWIMGAAIGLLITALLVINNLRDIDTDRAAGKTTLAVILGRSSTRWLYASCIVGAFLVVAVAATIGKVPAGAALGLVVSPAAIPVIRLAFATESGPPLVAALKGTSHLQAAFSLVASAGIIWLG